MICFKCLLPPAKLCVCACTCMCACIRYNFPSSALKWVSPHFHSSLDVRSESGWDQNKFTYLWRFHPILDSNGSHLNAQLFQAAALSFNAVYLHTFIYSLHFNLYFSWIISFVLSPSPHTTLLANYLECVVQPCLIGFDQKVIVSQSNICIPHLVCLIWLPIPTLDPAIAHCPAIYFAHATASNDKESPWIPTGSVRCQYVHGHSEE